MTDHPSALSTIPPASPAEADYDALYQTIMGTGRGRWFLEEYGRRNRHADTQLVLEAIGRIEMVVRTEQAHQASRELRIGLLEMARAIAQTRADVAEIKPVSVRHRDAAEPKDAAAEVFAAAERLQDLAWTMRERGLDMAMCDQIADLSSAILSASALRDPNDRRAQKLGEVLRYLERRVDSMLDSADPTSPPAIVETDADRAGPALAVNGHAIDDGMTVTVAAPQAAVEAVEQQDEPAPEPMVAARQVETGAINIDVPAEPPAAAEAAVLDDPPESIAAAQPVESGAINIELPATAEPAADVSAPEPIMASQQVEESEIEIDLLVLSPIEAGNSDVPAVPIEPDLVEPESVAVAVAAELPVSAPPPPAMEPMTVDTEAEPADFLLEPLPVPPRPVAVADAAAAINGRAHANGHHDPAQSLMPPWYASQPTAKTAAPDPLAALRAMSAEERIALFT